MQPTEAANEREFSFTGSNFESRQHYQTRDKLLNFVHVERVLTKRRSLLGAKTLRALHRVAAEDPGARDLKPAKTGFALKFKGTADEEYVPKRTCEEQATQDSATLPEDTVADEEEDDASDGWSSEDVESQDSEGSSDEGGEINEVVRKSARVKTKKWHENFIISDAIEIEDD